MKTMRQKRKAPDFVLFITVISLLSIGLVMVFSASEYSTMIYHGDSFYFFKRQLLWALFGLVAMRLAMSYNYWYYKRHTMVFLGATIVMLVLVLLIGDEVNGATRQIDLGMISFSPAELVKLCLIMVVACGLAGQKERVKIFFKGVFPYLLLATAASGLILLQPDLGTAVSLMGIVLIMIFAAGARLTHLGTVFFAGVAAIALAVAMEPYRFKRFTIFLNPWADPQGDGFQTLQGLYAIGSGGFFGLGLGQSKQKFLYLPENHTDFIFAIIGEELGFIGASFLILLFAVFVWRGLKIAIASTDPFASLLATGITAWVGIQTIINIAMVSGLLPVTGIPLPFISFGGTSLLFTMIGVGILLNISQFTAAR